MRPYAAEPVAVARMARHHFLIVVVVGRMLARTHASSHPLPYLPSSSVPSERETPNWIPSLLRSSLSSSLPLPPFPFPFRSLVSPSCPFLFQPQPQLHLPMSSAAVVSSRARSNTSIARPFNNVSLFFTWKHPTQYQRESCSLFLSPAMVQRPGERGLTRSKSVGAIGKSARPYREWATVPAGKEATTRSRVSEAADRAYREV